MSGYQYPYLTLNSKTVLQPGHTYYLSGYAISNSYAYKVRGQDVINEIYLLLGEVHDVDGSKIEWIQLMAGVIIYQMDIRVTKSLIPYTNPDGDVNDASPYGRLALASYDVSIPVSTARNYILSDTVITGTNRNGGKYTIFFDITAAFLELQASANPASGNVIDAYLNVYDPVSGNTVRVMGVKITSASATYQAIYLSHKLRLNPNEQISVSYENTDTTATGTLNAGYWGTAYNGSL
jgi:hypothetical protein